MIATRCSAWVAGTGQSNLACYSMTKGALVTMTKHAAWALRRHHIRVNYLAVGWLLGSIDLGPEALFSDPRKRIFPTKTGMQKVIVCCSAVCRHAKTLPPPLTSSDG